LNSYSTELAEKLYKIGWNSRGQSYVQLNFRANLSNKRYIYYMKESVDLILHKKEVKNRDDTKSITYLRQCVGATGQLLLVLRIIAGGLAWPTIGAEVRPWFLFPQRWPLTGTLPYPGIPGCGPLSLQARRENISRFFSSHFIIIAWIPVLARSPIELCAKLTARKNLVIIKKRNMAWCFFST